MPGLIKTQCRKTMCEARELRLETELQSRRPEHPSLKDKEVDSNWTDSGNSKWGQGRRQEGVLLLGG